MNLWILGAVAAGATFLGLKAAKQDRMSDEVQRSAMYAGFLKDYFGDPSINGRKEKFDRMVQLGKQNPVTVTGIIVSAQAVDRDRISKGLPPIYPGSQTIPA